MVLSRLSPRAAALLLGAVLFALVPAASAKQATNGSDDVVRLPDAPERPRAPALESLADRDGEDTRETRLLPGGALLATFDTNGDQIISDAELETGIAQAFEAADQNGNGRVTGLEQKAWATSLPYRDDSLANPVRFDPNLDGQVSRDEFSQVLTSLADEYRAEADGELTFAALVAPQRKPATEGAERLREAARLPIERRGDRRSADPETENSDTD